MAYDESELIMISALVHFLFCPRRCALVHIEQMWEENSFTTEGRNLHTRAHDEKVETRPECRRIFGMPVRSLEWGITGQCDVVMVTPEGEYIPLEYKRGKPKVREMDLVQVCAQAICLEEMTGKKIQEGFIYYFKIKKRLHVVLDDVLRELTQRTIREVRGMVESRKTPLPEYSKRCESCSLKDMCMPETIGKSKPVDQYIQEMVAAQLSEKEGGEA